MTRKLFLDYLGFDVIMVICDNQKSTNQEQLTKQSEYGNSNNHIIDRVWTFYLFDIVPEYNVLVSIFAITSLKV